MWACSKRGEGRRLSLTVTFHNINDKNPKTSGEIIADIDTGSTLCRIPKDVAIELGLIANDTIDIILANGEADFAPIFLARIRISDLENEPEEVEVYATPSQHALIGMNLLENKVLHYDGKNSNFSLE